MAWSEMSKGETEATTKWYKALRPDQMRNFRMRGTNPEEKDAEWIPVQELVSATRRPYDEKRSINDASHTLLQGLRHSNQWWTLPLDPNDRSVSALEAINMLILKIKVPENAMPGDLYKH